MPKNVNNTKYRCKLTTLISEIVLHSQSMVTHRNMQRERWSVWSLHNAKMWTIPNTNASWLPWHQRLSFIHNPWSQTGACTKNVDLSGPYIMPKNKQHRIQMQAHYLDTRDSPAFTIHGQWLREMSVWTQLQKEVTPNTKASWLLWHQRLLCFAFTIHGSLIVSHKENIELPGPCITPKN